MVTSRKAKTDYVDLRDTIYSSSMPPSGAAVSSNSLPQLAGRQSRALRQRGKLEPGHAGMGIVEPQGRGGKSAVGSRDDALAPDDLGEPHDTFGDQFRVLHQ